MAMAPDAPVDVLVLGSYPTDLRDLQGHLGETLRGSVGGLEVVGKTSGVGIPAAGAATAKRVLQLEPRAVVVVGTAGVYPSGDGYQPGDVLLATSLGLLDLGVMAGAAGYPEPMRTHLPVDPHLHEGLARAAGPRTWQVPVASPLAATRDPEQARMAPQHLDVRAEHLEAFAVGQACVLLGVPLAVVLGVSYEVGADAAQQWLQMERTAGSGATRVVMDWLERGAAGLPSRSSGWT
jgi:nucleoside phosphorylase